MKLGIFQFNPIWGNKNKNLDKVQRILLSNDKVDLWILPELCTTGYQFKSNQEVGNLAEKFPGGSTSGYLKELSRDIDAGIIIGIAERSGKQIYNSAAIFESGKFIGIYRKVHLFYEEKNYFSPGQEAPEVFEIKGVKVGVMVCFDWIFPETARTLALKGAQLIAHPANLVLPYCQDAMVTRSIENKVITATANRIGKEARTGESLTFTGGSQVADVDGARLGQLGQEEENVLVVDIDPAKAEDKSINQYNDLFGDRRDDLYFLE